MLSTKLKEAAGNGADATLYVDDVFSTWLYTGTGTTQTITNGIDLAGKGGMVWTKERSSVGFLHQLYDSARGISKLLISNNTSQETTTTEMSSFNSTGYTVSGTGAVNYSGSTFVGWTFRKAAKFFDVVTYTGTGSALSVAHSLGSTPGFVIVKRTDTSGDWYCNPVAFTGWTDYLVLNSTAARATNSTVWNSTSPTGTTFTVGTNAGVNDNGGTYVAYLFANNAGGFGLTGTDSVISTTLVSSAGSGNTTVNLGWEPQFLMLKKTANASDWFIYDTMRGMSYATGAATLLANTAGAETAGISVVPTATGFVAALDNSFTYFCIAIRMPNKPPTTGTQVYNAIARTGTGAAATVTGVGFAPDMVWIKSRPLAWQDEWGDFDRLRSPTMKLVLNATSQETGPGSEVSAFTMDGCSLGVSNSANKSGETFINYFFRRAPGFFDEVCYTGTGSATTQAHNLGAVPELMIVKKRSSSNNWVVWQKDFGSGAYGLNELYLNLTFAPPTSGGAFLNTPTSTVFSISIYGATNASGSTYVAYLFATLAGISKVGSYTGNGTGQAIACGFSAGARFVLIKRTDSAGAWYTFDSARGLTVGSSPYLLLNSTAAEVTGNNGVYASTGGFTLGATASTTTNINAATYIFLAVA